MRLPADRPDGWVAHRRAMGLSAGAVGQSCGDWRYPKDSMSLPDDQQRAAIAARVREFEQALERVSNGADTQQQCLTAARQLMAALQALLNRMRQP